MTVLPVRMSVLGAVVVAAAVFAALLVPASPPADARSHAPTGWMPKAGPAFNTPIGGPAQQRRLLHRVISATNHAAPGSLIRMAVFSFGDPETEAHQRSMGGDRSSEVDVLTKISTYSRGATVDDRMRIWCRD